MTFMTDDVPTGAANQGEDVQAFHDAAVRRVAKQLRALCETEGGEAFREAYEMVNEEATKREAAAEEARTAGASPAATPAEQRKAAADKGEQSKSEARGRQTPGRATADR